MISIDFVVMLNPFKLYLISSSVNDGKEAEKNV